MSYSWEGFMQNMPPVTHEEELCKTCLHKSFIIYNLYTISMGRIYAKVEKSVFFLIDYKSHHHLQVYILFGYVPQHL